MNKPIFIIFLISFFIGGFSQDLAIPTDERKEKNELALGFNLNTHANIIGGFTLNYYHLKSTRMSNGFTVEFVNIKNPKELRVSSVTNSGKSTASYVFEKFNYLLTVRTLYSKRFLLFHKSTDEGVELSLNTAGGFAWGFKSPYYVHVVSRSSDSTGYYKYSDVYKYAYIDGPGGLFRGLNEAKMIPGGSVRLSGVIEFGFMSDNPIGLEIGTQIDSYSQKIDMINYAKNKNTFITGFLVLYAGLRW